MTTHNLFFGGQRTNNPEWAMLPSVEPKPDDYMEPDARGTPVWFSLTRRLTFRNTCASCGGCSDICPGCPPPADLCKCGGKKMDGGSAALAKYVEGNSIVEGDILNSVIVPKGSALAYVWWKVANPVPGLTLELRVRGNASSVGGTALAPVPIVLGTIDGAACDEGLICVPAFNGCLPYFNQNDMLQVVVSSLPAPDPDACNDCGCCDPCSGIRALSLVVSPVVLFPCRGFN